MRRRAGGDAGRASWLAGGALCLLLALLGACALQAGPREQAPAAPGVLAYYDRLENASRVDALVEAARLLATAGEGDRLEWELRLALLWSVSVLATEDSTRAARCLLEVSPVADAPFERAGDYRALARIWRAQLLLRDNLRLADAALAQAENARREAEQARQRLHRELDEVLADSLGQGERIRALEARIDLLSRQIEALTSIEQQLVEREQEQAQGE